MDTIRWRKLFFHSDRRWFYENGRSSASGPAVSPRTAPMSGRCTRCLPIFSARRTGTCRGRLCVFAAGILRRDVLPGARLPVHPRRLRGGARRRHRRCDHALRTQMAPVNRKFHAERPAGDGVTLLRASCCQPRRQRPDRTHPAPRPTASRRGHRWRACRGSWADRA